MVSVFIIGLGTFFLYEIGKIHSQFDKEIPKAVDEIKIASELDSTAQFIRYYDEILTQSARNYAFTGDEKWLNRYNEYLPKLDEMITKTLSEGDSNDRVLFENIDEANQALVQMETASQEATKSGNKELAISILESPEYINEKKIYSDALISYSEKRGVRYDEVIQTSTNIINNLAENLNKVILETEIFGTFVFFVIIILTIILGYSIIGSITKPINELKNATAFVTQGNLDVRINANSKDEIGELANNFNLMVEAVKESRATINHKVEEQTRDLRKFKLAVQNASDHIVITDSEGLIIFANKSVERITGFSNSEVIGKKAGGKELWGGDMDNKFYDKLWRTIKEDKKVFSGEIKNHRKNGEKYTALASISPVLDEKGNLEFFVGIERDITQEKLIDQAKTEFVSLASHQLRTPLSAVNWYAEMLLDGDVGKLNSDQKKYVEEIYNGNQRMVDLVNALLNVSRIELGTFAIEPEKTNVVEIAKSLLKEVKVDIEKKHQKVIEKYDKNLPLIMADKNLLRVVIQNLLTNAIKYTPDKGKITIEILEKEPNLEINISDTGYGIPKSQQSRIFEKLFRADNIRAKDTEGTGLGLYIVKSIITQSGGNIRFDSEENKGTKFYISIPLKGMNKKEGTKAIEDIK